jgi:hypothetical protein
MGHGHVYTDLLVTLGTKIKQMYTVNKYIIRKLIIILR